MIAPSKLCSLFRALKINRTTCSQISKFSQKHQECVKDGTKLLNFYQVIQESGNIQANDNYCIYELDNCGQLIKYSQNGTHLLSCKDYVCPDTHYKCSNFYCIPWRYVCDGIWHCPGGTEEDETNCERLSCPKQFHCANSHL